MISSSFPSNVARDVIVIGYSGAVLLEVAGASEAFHSANVFGAHPPYRVSLASLGAQQIRSSPGLWLTPQVAIEDLSGKLNTIIVPGGARCDVEYAVTDRRLIEQVIRTAALGERISSAGTGAAILAAAGLLDGRRVTTHWAFADNLALCHPKVSVDPNPLYVKDGRIYTSAGVASTLDLALAFIEEDHGPEIARSVARTLVTYLHRSGEQAQLSIFVADPPANNPVVRSTVDFINANLEADLATGTLATRGGVSTRHLTRLFERDLSVTPAQFVRAIRTEAAANLLMSTRLPIATIARRCGFGTLETLRQVFRLTFGASPSEYRSQHRASDAPGKTGETEKPSLPEKDFPDTL